MSTIAIVGAGPGLGAAIARTFGRRGFDVALIARNRSRLSGLATQLNREGITSAVFVADVRFALEVNEALAAAAARFGRIDVLEFSPGAISVDPPIPASAVRRVDVQSQMDIQMYGALAATQAVLPAMRVAGTGTLLYTTGAGSIDPLPSNSTVTAADAALRNWTLGLHKELAGVGVQAAHIGIDVAIDRPTVPGLPVASADEIAPLYWTLHKDRRDVAEFVFSSELREPQTIVTERFTLARWEGSEQ